MKYAKYWNLYEYKSGICFAENAKRQFVVGIRQICFKQQNRFDCFKYAS